MKLRCLEYRPKQFPFLFLYTAYQKLNYGSTNEVMGVMVILRILGPVDARA